MASEAWDILNAFKDILGANSEVSNILHSNDHIYIFDDEITIVEEKKTYPFINLDIDVRETVNADNHRRYDYERHQYKILVSFAVREKTKQKAKISIWEFAEAIESAYAGSKSLRNNVKIVSSPADIVTDALRVQDENFWMGRGFMFIDVYKDICLRT